MSTRNETSFELTDEHLTLLRHSYVDRQLSDVETGAAWLDPKRPYGNSDVDHDIAELLGWCEAHDELSDELSARASKLHAETPTALQIVLVTGAFQAGRYHLATWYDARSWVAAS